MGDVRLGARPSRNHELGLPDRLPASLGTARVQAPPRKTPRGAGNKASTARLIPKVCPDLLACGRLYDALSRYSDQLVTPSAKDRHEVRMQLGERRQNLQRLIGGALSPYKIRLKILAAPTGAPTLIVLPVFVFAGRTAS